MLLGAGANNAIYRVNLVPWHKNSNIRSLFRDELISYLEVSMYYWYVCKYIYIYIYREREREIDRKRETERERKRERESGVVWVREKGGEGVQVSVL